MISCKGCGADMRFDIDKQALVCDYCDSVVKVTNNMHTRIVSEEHLMDAVVHTCPQCGAQLFTTEDTAATFCSYCGSSVLLESRLVAVNKPDYIIPFKISEEEARKAYKKKLRSAIFAPASLKKAEIEHMRGIYMPYWEYYMKETSDISFPTYRNIRTEGNYQLKDQYNINFKAYIESDGLEFDASSKLPDDLSQSYAPYNFKESKIFCADYMSGFYADLGNVPSDVYTDKAIRIVKSVVVDEIIYNSDVSDFGGTKSEIERDISLMHPEVGLAMYPVWFACARDKKGKYINYAAVNGQTGKVAADMPIDKKKLFLWTFIFAIPFFALLYFWMTPKTVSTVLIVAVLAIAGMLLGFNRANKMEIVDEGKKAVGEKGITKSVKKLYTTGFIIRTAVIVFLTVAILVVNPIEDILYYIVACVNAILCGWTFIRIFDIYNKFIQRPLPQLGKRGGEGK